MGQGIEITVEINTPKRGGEFWRKQDLNPWIIIKVITEPPAEPLTMLKRKTPVNLRLTGILSGERGRRYQVTILRNSLILNSCTSQNFIFFALLWRRTGARQNAPNHWNSESLLNEFTYFKKSMTAVMPENRVFASEFGSSYCTFPGLHQTVLMPAHGGFFKPWSGVQIIIRIVIPYSYKRSFTSHDVWNPIGEMVL